MKESMEDKIFHLVVMIFLSIILGLVLYPLLFILNASFSDPFMVTTGQVWLLPKGFTTDGYRRVFQNSDILMGYKNTIFYVLLGTSINLFVTLTCAFSLSRKDFIGRNFFMILFSFTMFFSGGLIPNYLVVKNLGMINTVWALVIPNAVGMWNVVISRTFFQTNIPMELQESASIDGSSITRMFISIVLPLSKPIIAVMLLFYAVGHWNSFFLALIYISDRSKYPLQLILREILILQEMKAEMMQTGDELDDWLTQVNIVELIKYAVMIVSTIPVLLLYPLLQKYFVQGIMIGSLKG